MNIMTVDPLLLMAHQYIIESISNSLCYRARPQPVYPLSLAGQDDCKVKSGLETTYFQYIKTQVVAGLLS